jgi:hypothetical protein
MKTYKCRCFNTKDVRYPDIELSVLPTENRFVRFRVNGNPKNFKVESIILHDVWMDNYDMTLVLED